MYMIWVENVVGVNYFSICIIMDILWSCSVFYLKGMIMNLGIFFNLFV